jgi:hypothetical protein
MIRIITMFACCICLAMAGCASRRAHKNGVSPIPGDVSPATKSTPKAPKVSPPSFPVTRFSTAKEAFLYVVNKTNPTIIGVGELHQREKTVLVRSAIVHFTEDLLPAIAGSTADLVVETWVSTGDCGETETQTTQEVGEVTERPAETENETVRLLRTAFQKNIQSHLLEMSCEDYHRIYDAEGGVDYMLLLQIVGERLG